MGTWTTETPTVYTNTDYQIGWLDYTGGEYGLVPTDFNSNFSTMDDTEAANFADGLALANSSTVLGGAHAGVKKTVTVTTTTISTYVP